MYCNSEDLLPLDLICNSPICYIEFQYIFMTYAAIKRYSIEIGFFG